MFRDGLDQADNRIVSVLMIGQSNMAGRGEFGDVEPIVNPDCYMLRMGRWQPLREPVNPDRPIFSGEFHTGVSMASSFADALQRHWNRPVGMIPCADGGTSIAQWMPGEVLFDHAVMMTRLAMRTSRFGGIIWHQGEADAKRGDLEGYRRDLVAMMTELRRRLNAEHLPLVLGELSTQTNQERYRFGDWPQRLNAALPEIARELPNCAVASAEGLTLKPDGLHFNAESFCEFGRRYFEKFISV